MKIELDRKYIIEGAETTNYIMIMLPRAYSEKKIFMKVMKRWVERKGEVVAIDFTGVETVKLFPERGGIMVASPKAIFTGKPGFDAMQMVS